MGNRDLASYTYRPNNGKLETLTYGNGLSAKYVYDALDRIVKIDYNIGEGGAIETVYEYTYNAAGREDLYLHLRRMGQLHGGSGEQQHRAGKFDRHDAQSVPLQRIYLGEFLEPFF